MHPTPNRLKDEKCGSCFGGIEVVGVILVPQPEPDFGQQEMAATHIQSVFRGYQVRKGLKAQPDVKQKAGTHLFPIPAHCFLLVIHLC